MIGIEGNVPPEDLVLRLVELDPVCDLKFRGRTVRVARDDACELLVTFGDEGLRMKEHWAERFWSGPHCAKEPTRLQDAADFVKGKHGIHPVPGRGSHD